MIYKIKLDGKVLYYPGDRQAAVINPELDLQTGYAGELTLKVPPLNPLYGEIHNRKVWFLYTEEIQRSFTEKSAHARKTGLRTGR